MAGSQRVALVRGFLEEHCSHVWVSQYPKAIFEAHGQIVLRPREVLTGSFIIPAHGLLLVSFDSTPFGEAPSQIALRDSVAIIGHAVVASQGFRVVLSQTFFSCVPRFSLPQVGLATCTNFRGHFEIARPREETHLIDALAYISMLIAAAKSIHCFRVDIRFFIFCEADREAQQLASSRHKPSAFFLHWIS